MELLVAACGVQYWIDNARDNARANKPIQAVYGQLDGLGARLLLGMPSVLQAASKNDRFFME